MQVPWMSLSPFFLRDVAENHRLSLDVKNLIEHNQQASGSIITSASASWWLWYSSLFLQCGQVYNHTHER